MACAGMNRMGQVLGALTIMAGVAVVFPAQPVAGGPATDAVKSSINEVIQILDDKELKKPGRVEERRRKLEQVIGNRFSYEEMAKRSLGAPWKELNEAERKEFVELYQRLLSKSYAGKIEGYSGEQIQYLNERHADEFAEVRTKIVSGKAEIPLDYRLLQIAGHWRVYDVVVDGVSLVNNYRGQFTKIIRESSYKGLVEQLRKKSESVTSPASQ